MRSFHTLISALAIVLFVGCGDSRGHPWHEPLPSLFVELDSSATYVPVLARVEAVPAPEVRFLALLQPDPNHVVPVFAPVTGVVIRIAPAHQVQRAETLVVMGQGSAPGGQEVAVRAEHAGNWRSRSAAGQSFWQNDTLGVLEESGFLWAVGAVSGGDSRLVHRDDPATVLIGDDADPQQLRLPGRVESVRGPGMSGFSADVAVEVRSPREGYRERGSTTVIVRPSGPGDSLAAIPASAVVQLPLGTAVFVPAGARRYEVRWVSAGSPVGDRIVVREGLRPRTSVVARDLGVLLDAARDSLGRRPIPR